MADVHYEFLPWARRGLARAHTNQQALGRPVLPTVQVGLQLQGSVNEDASASAQVPLKMIGPADVVGIDPRTIIRTEPRAGNHDFEPNYLAAIEFDPPDFPWLLTPARADAQQRLLPWLALVVFKRDEVDGEPRLRSARLLPSLTLRGTVPLPDLSQAWLWAHAQVLRNPQAGDVGTDAAGLANTLKNEPQRNLSRLVCPRRLEPGQSYIACVVPLFEQGLLAGLGRRVDPNATLSLAWEGGEATDLELPVYYHWTFSTGPAGDFEALARRLKAPMDPGSPPSLATLGRMPVEVDADLLFQDPAVRAQGPAAVKAAYVAQYEGAMLSLTANVPPQPARAADIASELAAILNAGEQRALGNLALEDEEPEVPLVGPPVYGAWHARAHSVNPTQTQRWLHGLNLRVPQRMAAGVGTRLVQKHQEVFMQAAWSQMGDILKAERLLSMAHLSVRALGCLVDRVNKLAPERRLQFLAPAAARMASDARPSAGGAPLTIWGYQQTTSLPEAAGDGALRRGLASQRPYMRRAAALPQGGLANALTRAHASTDSLVGLLAAPRFRTDGIRSLRALDGIAIAPGGPARLDVPGLGTQLPVALLATLQGGQRTLQAQPAAAFQRPSVAARLRTGVLLDASWARVDELLGAVARQQFSSGFQPDTAMPTLAAADLAQGLLATRKLRAEGVLLAAVQTNNSFALAPPQALRVDSRDGRVHVAAAAPRVMADMTAGLQAAGSGVEQAAVVKPGALASVPIAAIRQHGPRALFASLPVGTLAGGDAAGVALGSRAGGRFGPPRSTVVPALPQPPAAGVPPGLAGGRIGVTTLPPELGAPVLARFRQAWAERLEREAAPALPRGVALQPVPFDTPAAVQAAGLALDMKTLVPRRVQGLLQLAGSGLDITRGRAGMVGDTLLNLERYVLPKLWDRVMAYPKIEEALYAKLANMDREAFLPGAQEIPNDSILLLKTNPRFVESFLVGANHEMGREMLWRGFPTDQRGTPFQRFWPYFDRERMDVLPIHQWQASKPIGQAGGTDTKEQLVLLVRGQLLRRYPNTNVYAIARDGTETPARFDGSRAVTGPDAAGLLPPDISFFVFPIAPVDAPKYWFVLEEPMTEPRFGFDDGEAPRQVPRVRRRGGGQLMQRFVLAPGAAAPLADTWLDVDWGDVGTAPGSHLTLAQLASVNFTPTAQLPPGTVRSLAQLNSASAHAGQAAAALLQRPFRGYFAGTRLATGNPPPP